jgi:hypothetical protein
MTVCRRSCGFQMKGKDVDRVPLIGVKRIASFMGTSIPWALSLDSRTPRFLRPTGPRLHGLTGVRHRSGQTAGEQGRAELWAQWNELRLER